MNTLSSLPVPMARLLEAPLRIMLVLAMKAQHGQDERSRLVAFDVGAATNMVA